MNFNIRMGIPEMQELWQDLQQKYRSGKIKKKEEQLYKKWGGESFKVIVGGSILSESSNP